MDKLVHQVQSRALKALAHPTRIAMLEMMRHGPICSCEIEPVLSLRQANVSQHLAILRDSHLVTSYRDGSRVMYAATDPRIFDILDVAKAVMYDQFEETTHALAVVADDVA